MSVYLYNLFFLFFFSQCLIRGFGRELFQCAPYFINHTGAVLRVDVGYCYSFVWTVPAELLACGFRVV